MRAAMQRNVSLASLKSLKKPGNPPRKLKFHQKLLRSARNVVHSILNGSSKALSKAVIVLAAVEVRGRRPLCILPAYCCMYLILCHGGCSVLSLLSRAPAPF